MTLTHLVDIVAARCMVLGLLAFVVGANPAAAQSEAPEQRFPLERGERSVLCGPRVVASLSETPLRLIGSDEGPLRRMFSPRESLIVSGGLAHGLESGQLFVVRRPGLLRLQPPEIRGNPKIIGIRTLGVIRLLTVDDELSSAEVLEMCEGFTQGDYLEPFEPMTVPTEGPRDEPPDYTNTGVVLFADPSRRIAGPGDLVVANSGSDTVRLGQTITIYRLALMEGGPVHEVATGVAVAVDDSTSMIRIDAAREAVYSGDRIAPHGRP